MRGLLCLLVGFGLGIVALPADSSRASAPDTLIFGGDLDYPPYERDDNGTPVGFHIDLEQALGRAGSTPVSHRLGPWPEIVEALRTGEVDVVPMLRSEERERHFWFSEPIYFASHAIFTRSDPGRVTQLSDLRGWRVAVERSSYAHDQLMAAGHGGDLVLAVSTLQAVEAIASDEADYAVLVPGPASRLARRQELPIQRVGMPLWPQEYAFAVRKDRREVIQFVRSSLDEIVTSGEFQRIRERWEAEIEPSTAEPQGRSWTQLIAVCLALLLLAILGLSVSYRRTISAERGRRAIAEGDASFLASHDAVTRLPTRSKFQADLERAIADGNIEAPADLLVLKVLNANRIAKTHGREALDGYLRSLAEVLEETNLPAGYFAAATFAVLVGSFEAHSLVERLESVRLGDDHPGDSRIVWGAARFPKHSEDAQDIIDKAEIALSSCIARGMKSLIYHHSLQPSDSDLSLIGDFEAFGRHDIYVEYQPQLDLASGRICAAEALIRWDHPTQGLIPPARFIPLLEGAGLVSIVTNRVVEEALRQSAKFDRLGISCLLSINISVHDVLAGDFLQLLSATLRRTGAKARNLVVELTESVAVEEPARMRYILQQLRGMGIRTAIDDFGTGFSSLANLTEIPFDEIKIDRLFVSRMLDSPSHRSAVVSVIDMAHEMGLEVVAEGVADEAVIAALRAKGCDRAQGYAISVPLSGADLTSFVSNWPGGSGSGEAVEATARVIDFARSAKSV